MTIDAPYTCCWGWALVFGYQAVFRGSAWAWPAAGVVVGLGILAKYTMVVWLLSLFLFLLVSANRRPLLWRPGVWVMSAIAATCCLPLVLWNMSHDWVGLRHVAGQTGLAGNPAGVRWLGPLAYLGTQFALLLGFWFVAWLIAMIVNRRGKEPGASYLWWMSAPVFLVFLGFSFAKPAEPNWPVAAYISGFVLTVAWIVRRLEVATGAARFWTGFSLVTACALGLAITVVMHHSELLQPVLARLGGPETAAQPLPLRRFDPTCRLRGWRTLATEVDRIRRRLRQEGIEAVLAGSGWTLPGELAFYCQGHPPVHSLGLALGDRHSQYDLWHPNPLADPEAFAQQTFIFVGAATPPLRAAFTTLEPPVIVTHTEAGHPIACWTVTVCRGFHGLEREIGTANSTRADGRKW